MVNKSHAEVYDGTWAVCPRERRLVGGIGHHLPKGVYGKENVQKKTKPSNNFS